MAAEVVECKNSTHLLSACFADLVDRTGAEANLQRCTDLAESSYPKAFSG